MKKLFYFIAALLLSFNINAQDWAGKSKAEVYNIMTSDGYEYLPNISDLNVPKEAVVFKKVYSGGLIRYETIYFVRDRSEALIANQSTQTYAEVLSVYNKLKNSWRDNFPSIKSLNQYRRPNGDIETKRIEMTNRRYPGYGNVLAIVKNKEGKYYLCYKIIRVR